jgi:hypothetical protein
MVRIKTMSNFYRNLLDTENKHFILGKKILQSYTYILEVGRNYLNKLYNYFHFHNFSIHLNIKNIINYLTRNNPLHIHIIMMNFFLDHYLNKLYILEMKYIRNKDQDILYKKVGHKSH